MNQISKRAGEQGEEAGTVAMGVQVRGRGCSVLFMQGGDLPAGSMVSPGRCMLLQGVYK